MYVVYNLVIMEYLLLSCFFFFKQKTAYEMRISDWSSDVCSSDLGGPSALKAYVFPRPCYTPRPRCGAAIADLARGADGPSNRRRRRLARLGAPQPGQGQAGPFQGAAKTNSEERRVGKGCGRKWRSQGAT